MKLNRKSRMTPCVYLHQRTCGRLQRSFRMFVNPHQQDAIRQNTLLLLLLYLTFFPPATKAGIVDSRLPDKQRPKHQSEYTYITHVASAPSVDSRDASLPYQEEVTEHVMGSGYVDAWYYLFSTVPQTFAAVYALFFGFALFRLQQIRQTLERVEQEIKAFFNRVGLKEDYSAHCAADAANHTWDLYLEKLEMLQSQQDISKVIKADHDHLRSEIFLVGRIKQMKSNVNMMRIFWGQFQKSFLFTSVLIASTIILIPLGDFVNIKFFLFSWAILSILVVITTILYIRLVKKLLPLLRARAQCGGTITSAF